MKTRVFIPGRTVDHWFYVDNVAIEDKKRSISTSKLRSLSNMAVDKFLFHSLVNSRKPFMIDLNSKKITELKVQRKKEDIINYNETRYSARSAIKKAQEFLESTPSKDISENEQRWLNFVQRDSSSRKKRIQRNTRL